MCGGQNAVLDWLDDDQRETRTINGCDGPAEPAPRYAILCPGCDGPGCSECGEGNGGEFLGPKRGYVFVNRCPASFFSDEFGEYLRSRAWLKRGTYVYDDHFTNLPARFVQFCEELEAEIARVHEAEMEAERERARG